MLIKGAILVILLLAAFFFLGLKMSESITNPGVRGFFFALFFLTIFTVFNIILSFYFIIKLQGKRGPPGKKGMDGSMGDSGENGKCEISCKKKTIELMIRNKIEELLVNMGESGLSENDNKVFCATFKNLESLNDEKLDLSYLKNINNNLESIQISGSIDTSTKSRIFVFIKEVLTNITEQQDPENMKVKIEKDFEKDLDIQNC